MLNLCLVVIATQFSETKKRETERMRLERKRFHSSSTLGSLSEPGGCYDEIVKLIGHLYRQLKRRVNRFIKRIIKKNKKDKKAPSAAVCISPLSSINTNLFARKTSAPRASPELFEIDPLSSPNVNLPLNEGKKVMISSKFSNEVQMAEFVPGRKPSSPEYVPNNPEGSKRNSLMVPPSVPLVTFNTSVHVNSHFGEYKFCVYYCYYL